MNFVRNMQDEESREFWRGIDAGVREFESWPAWKRRMVLRALDREDPQEERPAVEPEV